jgi:hypothetical protein
LRNNRDCRLNYRPTLFLRKALIKELIAHGILQENIEVIVYQDTFRKTIKALNKFSPKHLNWNAEINNTVVNFIDKEFDLLISYYDIEKQFY